MRKGNTIGSTPYSMVHGERPALCCARWGLEMGVGDCVDVVNVQNLLRCWEAIGGYNC